MTFVNFIYSSSILLTVCGTYWRLFNSIDGLSILLIASLLWYFVNKICFNIIDGSFNKTASIFVKKLHQYYWQSYWTFMGSINKIASTLLKKLLQYYLQYYWPCILRLHTDIRYYRNTGIKVNLDRRSSCPLSLILRSRDSGYVADLTYAVLTFCCIESSPLFVRQKRLLIILSSRNCKNTYFMNHS